MKIIGVYPICNTGGILLHDIDYNDDKVLVSTNGKNTEWCSLTEMDDEDGLRTGFYYGKMFVPLDQVMRYYGDGV